MTFTINSLTRCAGLNHWHLVITIGGVQHTIVTSPGEVAFDPTASVAETREQIIARCRSAAKEGSAGTFALAKTLLEGKTYQL